MRKTRFSRKKLKPASIPADEVEEVPVGAIIGGPFAALIGGALNTVFEAVRSAKDGHTPKPARKKRKKKDAS